VPSLHRIMLVKISSAAKTSPSPNRRGLSIVPPSGRNSEATNCRSPFIYGSVHSVSKYSRACLWRALTKYQTSPLNLLSAAPGPRTVSTPYCSRRS
jgi:hypothetical protein